jgi:hypothetical protein
MDPDQKYDQSNPSDPNRSDANKLTPEDVKRANKLGARTHLDYWHPLFIESISAIPDGLDLICMTDEEWQSVQQDIEKCLSTLLNNIGIACAVLTKVLHIKRPNLIPVCDSIIIEYMLPRSDIKSAATITKIMNEFRKDGKRNLETLSSIKSFLEQKGWKPALSNLRMLEKLYWMEKVSPYKELWPVMEVQGWWR